MMIRQRFVRFVPSGRRDVLRRHETSGRPSLREVRRSGPARTLARKSGLPELFLANGNPALALPPNAAPMAPDEAAWQVVLARARS
jgi:hypothetical protein